MYRVLIVEDTPAEADLLRALLGRYSAEKGVELSATVMTSALEFIESRRAADLVLMDIDMPGINGMEAAEVFRTYDAETPLIFVTNLAQYAVRGYSVDALDFVVKPVEYPDLAMRLDRAVRVMERNAGTTLALPTADGVRVVASRDVLYVDLLRHDVQYHLAGGDVLSMRGSLKAAEAQLIEAVPGGFVRVSSGCLVNMAQVARIEGDGVTAADGQKIFFSRSQKSVHSRRSRTSWAGACDGARRRMGLLDHVGKAADVFALHAADCGGGRALCVAA